MRPLSYSDSFPTAFTTQLYHILMIKSINTFLIIERYHLNERGGAVFHIKRSASGRFGTGLTPSCQVFNSVVI